MEVTEEIKIENKDFIMDLFKGGACYVRAKHENYDENEYIEFINENYKIID